MRFRATNHPCRRGFSLTELTIVLGIIGLILGAIWAAASKASDNNKALRATAQVTQILTNFKGIYGNRPVDLADGTDVTGMAVTNALLPPDMLPSGISCTGTSSATCSASPVGPWTGSTVKLTAYSSSNSISIIYSNLSQAACDRFADNMATGNPGLIYTNINGTTTSGAALPLTASKINTQCSITATNTNSVEVRYGMAN